MTEPPRISHADAGHTALDAGWRRVLRWLGLASLAVGMALCLVAFVLGEIGGDDDAGWLFVVGFASMLCGVHGLFLRGSERRFALIWVLVWATVWGMGSSVVSRFFAGSHAGWDDALALLVLTWAYLPVGTLPGRWRDLWLGIYLACFISVVVWLFAPIGLPPPHWLPSRGWLFAIGTGVPLAVMGLNNVGARALIGLVVIGIVVVRVVAPLLSLTGISGSAATDISFLGLFAIWIWFSVPARVRWHRLAGLFRMVFSLRSLFAAIIAAMGGAGVAAGVYFLIYRYLPASRPEALDLAKAYFIAVSALIWMAVLAKLSRHHSSGDDASSEPTVWEAALSSPAFKADLARVANRVKTNDAEKASAVASMNHAEMERLERMLRERKS